MVATVAVLSDIHGVLPALEAVLEEPVELATDPNADNPWPELRRTVLDTAAAADRIVAESAYDDVQAWVDEYVRTNSSDIQALAAFTPDE